MTGRNHIFAVATRYKIPTIGNSREYAAAGSVISYGASITEAHRQAALYVGKILRGDKPSDLPVQQSTRFEMVINLKAARVLGIEVPLTLIALADEVIE